MLIHFLLLSSQLDLAGSALGLSARRVAERPLSRGGLELLPLALVLRSHIWRQRVVRVGRIQQAADAQQQLRECREIGWGGAERRCSPC